MSTLHEFHKKWALKVVGAVIPGKNGFFLEASGEVWMKTPTKFQKITNDEEATAAIKEVSPGEDW